MAGYDAGLINVIDARVAAKAEVNTAMGSYVKTEDQTAYVVFDGHELALPCKYAAGVPLTEGCRVMLRRVGSTWVVTQSFSRESPPRYDLPLFNSWVNYLGAFSPATYQMEGRLVVLEGAIKSGTVTAGTKMAELPPGFRPDLQRAFSVAAFNGTARLDVRADGSIIAGLGVQATFTFLDGIAFTARG